MSSIGSFILNIHQVLSDPALQLFVSTSLSGASIILAQKSNSQSQGRHPFKKKLVVLGKHVFP